jgi:hypothetical protein
MCCIAGQGKAPGLDLGIAVYIQITEYINYFKATIVLVAEELRSQRSEIISILLLRDWSRALIAIHGHP